MKKYLVRAVESAIVETIIEATSEQSVRQEVEDNTYSYDWREEGYTNELKILSIEELKD